MKLIYIIFFLFAAIAGCKKESTPEESEQWKLAAMTAQINNDWKIVKMTFVKPDSLYGFLGTRYCMDKDTFSFKANNVYEFTTDSDCNASNVKGVWRLANQDSLYIDYNFSGTYLEYQKIKLAKVSADTMKWHVTTYTTNNIDTMTVEYTLIPTR